MPISKKMFSRENWLERATSHNVEKIFSKHELLSRLKSRKKIRIKFGVDVTSPLIHIGNAVNLWKMREFQEMGHKVVFLIGDFTSRIGDPTGKSKTRPPRTKKEIEQDAQTYIEQVKKILLGSSDVFEVRRNSEWYDNMKLGDFLKLCAHITHARLIQRDMFQERIKKNTEIFMHEILYPILQGYDSYVLKSDITIIGSDQLFNELLGRHYQSLFGQDPQVIMTTVITPGLHGKEKQSKSLGNFIAIADSPEDKFGKVMSLPDSLIITYYRVYTFIDARQIDVYEKQLAEGINPRDIKIKLARDLVALYHSDAVAEETKEQFIKTFSKKNIPKNLPTVTAKQKEPLVDFLARTKLVASKSSAKRLIAGGAIELDGKKIQSSDTVTKKGALRVGKTKFIRVV